MPRPLTRWRLDLDHVRAEVAETHGADGAGEHLGRVEDADSRKGTITDEFCGTDLHDTEVCLINR